jgi:prepilin-type N-terminal cleavage/methylation domain-containing protein
MKKLNKKGFTLIELLVVVAIIAILAGIVLVSLNSARERSEKASLQSTMASVMPVLLMCENDNYEIQSVAANLPICLDGTGAAVDIDEQWPALPTNIATDYSYDLDGADPTALIGTKTEGETVTDIITCTIATGSCVMN